MLIQILTFLHYRMRLGFVRRGRYRKLKHSKEELELLLAPDLDYVDYKISSDFIIRVKPSQYHALHTMLGHFSKCPLRAYVEQLAPYMLSDESTREQHLTALAAVNTQGLGLWTLRPSTTTGTSITPDLAGPSSKQPSGPPVCSACAEQPGDTSVCSTCAERAKSGVNDPEPPPSSPKDQSSVGGESSDNDNDQ